MLFVQISIVYQAIVRFDLISDAERKISMLDATSGGIERVFHFSAINIHCSQRAQ